MICLEIVSRTIYSNCNKCILEKICPAAYFFLIFFGLFMIYLITLN